MSRIAFSLLVLLVAAGCSQRDATSPLSDDTHAARLSADRSPPEAAPVEIAFEKWFTAYPAMTGNTSLGERTFAGTILSRIAFDNGVIVQLQARYIVTDPTGEGHSFTALIAGTENLETQTAVLNGVITEGWMVGARVHVTFRIITPCALATGPSVKNVCFQGTIRIQ
jgi:hypothetical protein